MNTITNIYNEYGIPEILQLHMLRVAAIAEKILVAWNGPTVDRPSLLRVLLLHDTGNIVKMFDVENDNERFHVMREKYYSVYGHDDHKVSIAIGRELGLTDDELALMDGKVFIRNDETLRSRDFSRKIGAYADQRAAPDGVLPLLERLREAQRRYKDKPGSSMNNPRTEMLIECAADIEKQVMSHCNINPTDITDASISPFIPKLRRFRI